MSFVNDIDVTEHATVTVHCAKCCTTSALEACVTETENYGPGCDTCGDGSGGRIEVRCSNPQCRAVIFEASV